ncbi:MAG: quinolinate synthase NadA [Candidatus Geothermarchaeales archaeon]
MLQTQLKLIERINDLKERKNAVILVHNYQRPEIYRVADYIGDSYGLSKKATQTDADLIVFCGVDFMAESAYILNPDKTVLLPTREARCPMAAMARVGNLRKMKERHPDAAVVCYINTTAEIKAESDICCTSSNAVKVVNSLEEDEIIFVPDQNLAMYVARHTTKKIIPWNGWCYVHMRFSAKGLKEAKRLHPDAKVVVHPECTPDVIELADYVSSTSGMIEYAKNDDAKKYIVGTEIGLIERLKLELPEKTFYQAPPGATCIQMKKNNLRLVLESLEDERHKIIFPESIRKKAERALDRMLEV